MQLKITIYFIEGFTIHLFICPPPMLYRALICARRRTTYSDKMGTSTNAWAEFWLHETYNSKLIVCDGSLEPSRLCRQLCLNSFSTESSFQRSLCRPCHLRMAPISGILESECSLYLGRGAGVSSSVLNKPLAANRSWQIQARKPPAPSGSWTFPMYSGRIGNHLIQISCKFHSPNICVYSIVMEACSSFYKARLREGKGAALPAPPTYPFLLPQKPPPHPQATHSIYPHPYLLDNLWFKTVFRI